MIMRALSHPARLPNSILLVEDDAEIRTTIAEVLTDEGYVVRAAENGRDALEQLRTAPLPSLIILDLMMPVMNGVEFRREQLNDPSTADVPVLVMSADTNVRNIAKQLQAPYIRKPVALGELLKVVDQNCRQDGGP
jgi:CheY-like chemotaxis protein